MESIYNSGRIAPISKGSKQSNANGPVNQMLRKTEMKALYFRGRIQSKMTISNAQMMKQNQEATFEVGVANDSYQLRMDGTHY